MIAAAAMIFSLASCSVNDIEKSDVITADKTTAYAKVVISMPKVTGTRADFTPGEKNGSFDEGAAESKIKSINLAFYDENGTYVCQASLDSEMTIGGADEPQGNLGNNVSSSYAQVLRVIIPEGVNKPTQVVAFINTDVKTYNLDELCTNGKVTADAFAEGEYFVMTNAGYYTSDEVGKGDYMIAASINLYDTEDDAKSAVADVIYVERLAAKITVDVKKDDNEVKIDQDEANYVVKDVDDKLVTLKYMPKFWGATGTAKDENVVKTQFEKTATWMNAADQHRSYWAKSAYYTDTPYPTVDDSPLSYLIFKDIAGTADDDHDSDDDVMNATGKSNYVFEHTASVGIEGMDLISNTYVIVTGNYEVYVDGTLDESVYYKDEKVNFYLLSIGVDANEKLEDDEENPDFGKSVFRIFNETQLMKYLLNYNGISAVYEDEDGTEIEDARLADFFELKYKAGDDGVSKYYLAIKAGETVYVKNEEDDSYEKLETEEDLTLKKSTNSRHYYFPEGGAYFNVPIPQNISGSDITYGVVRNHSYVLTIEKIQSLGAPLDENKFTSDPDNPGNDPVIPDPNFDNYINAKINILSWHVVEHGVTL